MRKVIFNNCMIIFILPIMLFLQSCASSNVSREANDNAAVGYQNAASSVENLGDGSVADTYDNMSQSSKGAIIGGVAGAAAGGLIHGVGAIPGLAVGAILGGAYGAYIDSNTSLLDQLDNRGVKVIVLGDQVMLVLRSNRVFNAMTPQIRPGAYSTLDLVSAYLNKMTTMTIKVAAYTNTGGSERINCSLSKEQAESIVRYLWARKTNTRMLTAAGMGSADPVTKSASEWDDGWNYRVEITTQKMPTSGTL